MMVHVILQDLNLNDKYEYKETQIRTKTANKIDYSVMRIILERKALPYKCPNCNKIFNACKSKNETIIIHSMPVHGHLLEIEIPRHRINCKDCSYPYEPLPDTILTNPRVTRRDANWIYEKCKAMTTVDVEKEIGLSDMTIRKIEKTILEEKIKNRKIDSVKTIGIDEIKVDGYLHIISEMEQEEVLFVGEGRKSVELAPFLLKFRRFLPQVEWIVMDMWQGFITVFKRFCKKGKIIHDHFHISQHLNKALNRIRIDEFKKAADLDNNIIKGKKWLLLSRRTNLNTEQKGFLKNLLSVNRRILKAYLLKEEFVKLWKYKSYGWAMIFWQNWKKTLRWQRLKPLQKFAEMVDNHLEGIMNFYLHKDPLKMGYIEGLNNKIKVLLRKHYGFRDKKYQKLKIIQVGSKSLKNYIPYPWLLSTT